VTCQIYLHPKRMDLAIAAFRAHLTKLSSHGPAIFPIHQPARAHSSSEMASAAKPWTDSGAPDWRSSKHYQLLLGADRCVFAWEWLRRSELYRKAWRARHDGWVDPSYSTPMFGLERLEDPSKAAPSARPVWSRMLLNDALTADIGDPGAPLDDRVDLRLLSDFVTIVIDADESEHLLLSDGLCFLRIDIVSGTLIGYPASLTCMIRGLSRIRGPIDALTRLSHLVRCGHFPRRSDINLARQRRWLEELRVADALATGADHQSIARTLFPGMIAKSRWRTDSAPYRRRIQRLANTAKSRLGRPLSFWFDI
jgi:hypothetical protein